VILPLEPVHIVITQHIHITYVRHSLATANTNTPVTIVVMTVQIRDLARGHAAVDSAATYCTTVSITNVYKIACDA
jgi:hypothetical protein